MFTTLVESRAVRRRSARGATISIILHAGVIAGAVALTVPTRGDANPDVHRPTPVVYVPAPARVPEVPRPTTPRPAPPAAPTINTVSIPAPTITPVTLPPLDIQGPQVPPDRIVIGTGGAPSSPGRGELGGNFAPGTVLDAEVVDRVPRIIGNAPAPRYPDMLRQSGATGQVVVRFVVDTLGRAEMGELVVVEATHPLFASAVKNALLGYRFTPGEAGGRKVRTMVQVPFSFTLH